MKTVKFKIYDKGIFGLKNPTAIIVLDKQNLNGDYFLFADGKRIKYSLRTVQIENKIVFEGSVGSYRNIELVYIEGSTKYVICTLKNTLLFRIKNKSIALVKTSINKVIALKNLFNHGCSVLWKDYHFLVPPSEWKKIVQRFIKRIKQGNVPYFGNPFDSFDYREWIKDFEYNEPEIELTYKPLISILIPTYNIGAKFLSQCLDSVLNQSYQNFEICIADDCSTNQETLSTLKYYQNRDKRIKIVFRKENGHISNATNSALEIANGEYVGLLDNDDLLAPNALYEVVKALNDDYTIDMIYSDEDKLDLNGHRCEPHFKPDFSPDTLLSLNYICHFTVIKKELMEKVGGFEVGLEGAQDYDLFLKVTEQTKNIKHIPKILYHWRMIPGSTSMDISNKDYATDKGKIALENALIRRKIQGTVHKDPISTYYYIEYHHDNPKVSIIIPTKDHAEITRKCLNSIYEKTTYENFEILLVNNNSEEKETFELFDFYNKKYSNFKVIDANMPFNYSKINNLAIKQSDAEIIVLLNNDTEIITPEWLTMMVGYAKQKHIGAVGAKLLYPDYTVQHGGVIIGLGGVASHAYIGEKRDFLGMFGRLRVPYNYAAVTAACLAIDKSKLLEVSCLEEDLMVAYNDIDLNLKLLEKGYYNVVLPQVELLHYESKSRGLDTEGEKYKRFMKEENYMYNKWQKYIRNDPFYNKNFTKKYWFVLDKKGGQ
ncbi:glycosyltransferase [[Clostridium] spiroforme]|nr:glycosyltransferase [Thomasclavelia spiroformis]